MRRPEHEDDTASRILDVAERLVQLRGFNGFSYADVAHELGITKPALHYHFASKAELGEALVARYSDRFSAALAGIDQRCADAPTKLRAYADTYAEVLSDERMCLCGMLAAEYETLPSAMRTAVVRFFDQNETWLAAVLRRGRREGTVQYRESAREAAHVLISALEGAMLLARPYGDVRRFRVAAKHQITALMTTGDERHSGSE